jgi:hypothetical protein
MRGAIIPLPQYAFMAWCLVKHRDNFTFTFTSVLVGTVERFSSSVYYKIQHLVSTCPKRKHETLYHHHHHLLSFKMLVYGKIILKWILGK